MQEVLIPLSKTKIVLLILGCILFVVTSIFLWTIAEEVQRFSPLFIRIVCVAGVLLFGVIGVYTFRKLFDNKPGMIINEQGITNNTNAFGTQYIAWENVTGIDVGKVQSTRFLLIYVNNPQEIIDQQKGFKRFATKQNMKWYNTPIAISSNTLKYNFDKLLETVSDFYAKRSV